MTLWSRLKNLLRNLSNGRAVENDLDDEVRAFVELAADEKVAAGASAGQARREALVEIGGAESLKQSVREQRVGSGIESVLQDLRYGVRQLVHAPVFSVAVIVTLALSVGITVAVFSVLYAMLIRPLPYRDSDEIVALDTRSASGGSQGASWPEYEDWRRMTHSFKAMAGYQPSGTVGMEGGSGPVALREVEGTGNFFEVFGVNPILGRTFGEGEDQDGKNDVVVLSYEVWKQNFGGQSSVLGRRVNMDGSGYTVIGVMPAGFRFPINMANAVYVPMHLTANQRDNRGNHWLATVARLNPDVTAKQAEADLDRVFAVLGKDDAFNAGRTVRAKDLTSYVVGGSRGALRLLLYAVLAVLAIGCVNVAGLLMARGVKRGREVALRLAIGARRGRIARQLLTEAMVFAGCGAVGGVVLAYGLLRAMRLMLIASLARGAEVRVNLPVLAAALTTAVLVTVLAAVMPALRLSGTPATMVLKSGGSAGTSRGQHRMRSGFVVTQVALALALLLVSGLLLAMLKSLRDTQLGFSSDHLLTAEINLPRGRYQGRDVVADFYDPMLERVNALPGVRAAGMIQMLPVQGWGWNSEHIHIVGTPPLKNPRTDPAEVRFVSQGYYETIRDELLEGRLQDPRLDKPTTRFVGVVNEAFVKKFIPSGRDPIGMEIGDNSQTQTLASESDPRILIVGVVKNIRQTIYQPPFPEMDFLVSQLPAEQSLSTIGSMHLLIRTAVDPKSIEPSLRSALAAVDATVPLREPETMEEVIADVLTFERLENWLFGAFAALAIVLALVGLYGLISHEVELSSRDIGIRLAVGASRIRILLGVYRRVSIMLVSGVVIGLGVAWSAQRFINAVVAFKLSSDAPFVMGLAAAMMGIGLLASTLPARRASSIDPMTILRDQ